MSSSSVTPRTMRSGAPKSRAAFTNVWPHQPRPTIAVLSMQARLRCRRRAGLLERMGPSKCVVLGASLGDSFDCRVWRQVDFEEICACHLTRQADVRKRYLLALTIGAGVLLGRQMLFETRQRRLMPMLRPCLYSGFIDLELMREILAHARHNERM